MKTIWQKKLENNDNFSKLHSEKISEFHKNRSKSEASYRDAMLQKEGSPIECQEKIYHGDRILTFAGVRCYLD